MKKFIFTANVIAIVALVPAVIFGYLSNGNAKNNKAKTEEVAKDVKSGQDDFSILHLVRTF